MNNSNHTSQPSDITASHLAVPEEQESNRRTIIIAAVIGVLVLLAVVIGAIIWLLQPETDTGRIRDIFIIFAAILSLLLGLTLVVLIVQLAQLINLLQNELKPILESTNETISNLRGTTTFLSDNLAEPVIKASQFSAAFSQFMRIIGLTRKK